MHPRGENPCYASASGGRKYCITLNLISPDCKTHAVFVSVWECLAASSGPTMQHRIGGILFIYLFLEFRMQQHRQQNSRLHNTIYA